jgi:uncharacterized RDD family membrane protein YckC
VRETYTITTPENVRFEFELAGFFSRFVAWLVDILVIAVAFLAVAIATATLTSVTGGFGAALGAIFYFALNWGYFVTLEWLLGGQSLGKKAVGLRVLSDDGVRISLYQAAVRNLFRVLDSLPVAYLLGGGVALVNRHGKRLGDLAAGTLVVVERSRPVPDAIVPDKERYNSFVTDQWVRSRVSSRLGLAERELLVSLALRRESLPQQQRLRLFASLAEHLQQKLGVDKPEFFSDERFCLNITAVFLG